MLARSMARSIHASTGPDRGPDTAWSLPLFVLLWNCLEGIRHDPQENLLSIGLLLYVLHATQNGHEEASGAVRKCCTRKNESCEARFDTVKG